MHQSLCSYGKKKKMENNLKPALDQNYKIFRLRKSWTLTLWSAVQNQGKKQHIKPLNWDILFNDTPKIRLAATKYVCACIHICIHTHKVLEKLGKIEGGSRKWLKNWRKCLKGKIRCFPSICQVYLLMHNSTSNSRPEPACILPVYTPGKKSVLSFCLTV